MLMIVQYGLGNVRAFINAFARQNIDIEIADSPGALARATKIILPGVGAFDWAMTRLNESGLRDVLDDQVLSKKVPVLGVCVGMQMMAHRSAEGSLPGLGWVDAEVERLQAPSSDVRLDLPHMGWNTVSAVSSDDLFQDIPAPQFYFLHSYVVRLGRQQDMLASASYGGTFAAAIRSGHIYGTQFHPEKSHHWGGSLLRNFARL